MNYDTLKYGSLSPILPYFCYTHCYFDKHQMLQLTMDAIKQMKHTLLTTVGVLARLVVFWMTGVPVKNPAH
jgi:hypothetical protein